MDIWGGVLEGRGWKGQGSGEEGACLPGIRICVCGGFVMVYHYGGNCAGDPDEGEEPEEVGG